MELFLSLFQPQKYAKEVMKNFHFFHALLVLVSFFFIALGYILFIGLEEIEQNFTLASFVILLPFLNSFFWVFLNTFISKILSIHISYKKLFVIFIISSIPSFVFIFIPISNLIISIFLYLWGFFIYLGFIVGTLKTSYWRPLLSYISTDILLILIIFFFLLILFSGGDILKNIQYLPDIIREQVL